MRNVLHGECARLSPPCISPTSRPHLAHISPASRQVLQADKIVHEQQLGLNWFPPSEHIFQAGGHGEGGPISRGQMDNENIKRMLELLCNEAGFLVEGKIQKLLEPLPTDEQSLLRIDSILKVLG